MKKIEDFIYELKEVLPAESTITYKYNDNPVKCTFSKHQEKEHSLYKVDISYLNHEWTNYICTCSLEAGYYRTYMHLEDFTSFLVMRSSKFRVPPTPNKDIRPQFFKKFSPAKRSRTNYVIDGKKLVNAEVCCFLCQRQTKRHDTDFIISCSSTKIKVSRFHLCKNTTECDFASAFI